MDMPEEQSKLMDGIEPEKLIQIPTLNETKPPTLQQRLDIWYDKWYHEQSPKLQAVIDSVENHLREILILEGIVLTAAIAGFIYSNEQFTQRITDRVLAQFTKPPTPMIAEADPTMMPTMTRTIPSPSPTTEYLSPMRPSTPSIDNNPIGPTQEGSSNPPKFLSLTENHGEWNPGLTNFDPFGRGDSAFLMSDGTPYIVEAGSPGAPHPTDHKSYPKIVMTFRDSDKEGISNWYVLNLATVEFPAGFEGMKVTKEKGTNAPAFSIFLKGTDGKDKNHNFPTAAWEKIPKDLSPKDLEELLSNKGYTREESLWIISLTKNCGNFYFGLGPEGQSVSASPAIIHVEEPSTPTPTP